MGVLWVKETGLTVVVGLGIIVLLFADGGTGLQIDELRIPKAIRNGSATSIVLDCDYTLPEAERKGLVVKWYFNEDESPNPVYQWIPPAKPQGFGILKDRLNLNYSASDEEYKKHRALEITNPTKELSGEYKCTVSTFSNEESKSERLIIFVPERSLLVTQTKSGDSAVNVTCAAEGVYPEPEITIQRDESSDEEDDDEEEMTDVHIQKNDDLFDIYASLVLKDSKLDKPTTFLCELTIPGANYTATTSSQYMPGSNVSSRSASIWLLHLLMVLCLRL